MLFAIWNNDIAITYYTSQNIQMQYHLRYFQNLLYNDIAITYYTSQNIQMQYHL